MPEYHNPQQEPGTERRLLLVFALTFVVLLVAQPLLMKYMKPPQPPATEQQQQPVQPAAPAPATPPAAAAQAAAGAPAKGKKGAAAARQATSEAESVIENDLYRITFSNRGGQVRSWILKQYKDDHGNPLELVNRLGAEKGGYPLSLWTYDEGLRNRLNSALYVANASSPQAPSEISFDYADAELTVRKVFRFDHSYVVGVETEVTVNGSRVQAFPAWPAGFGDQTVPASYVAATVDYMPPDQKVVRLSADRKGEKLSGGGTIRGPFYWAGTVDQYFGAVFLPDQPDAATLVTLRNAITLPNQQTPVEVLGAAVGNVSGQTRGRVFVGPKTLDVLESIKASAMQGQGARPDLGAVVDFGKWFGFIAKPLFMWLHWTYDHWVRNWGWAIIILTVIINIALLPLRISSMKSAMKMQRVQPQVNAIKARYKGLSMKDPRRAEMNQEIAALFKRERVNPAGGCFPMLVQLPFLIAFYTMLGVAVELRHANWLWIRDLSSPDPWHILPIGIMVTTLLVQKLTPMSGMDPTQQKMMTIMMPVMLGVVSWSLAAGLGVYWVAGNTIAIVQQWVMNRIGFGKPHDPVKDTKRPLKKQKESLAKS